MPARELTAVKLGAAGEVQQVPTRPVGEAEVQLALIPCVQGRFEPPVQLSKPHQPH